MIRAVKSSTKGDLTAFCASEARVSKNEKQVNQERDRAVPPKVEIEPPGDLESCSCLIIFLIKNQAVVGGGRSAPNGQDLKPVQEESDMDNHNRNELKECSVSCEQSFRECLFSGKEEVFCRIRRATCDSSCTHI